MATGLCVNARGAWPDADELRVLGVQWVRSIVYDLDEFAAALDTYAGSGIQVIALCNQETLAAGPKPADWLHVGVELLDRCHGQLAAVECLNEWDLQGIPPKAAATFALNLSHYALQAKYPVSVLLGSVAGPDWAGNLTRACAVLGNTRLGGVCIHPYGQRAAGYPDGWGFGELAGVAEQALSIAHRPLYFTEYGVTLDDMGSPEGQAVYVARARRLFAALPSVRTDCLFGWSDALQPDRTYGLRDAAGAARPSWGAFMGAGPQANIGGNVPTVGQPGRAAARE